MTRIGKQKHYQANAGSPRFEELRALVLIGLADVLRAALVLMARGMSRSFNDRSRKGDDTAASDIDLMVIVIVSLFLILFAALEGASTQLGRKIAPTI